MIEEIGQVIAVEGDYIVVQTQPRSTCSSCHVGSDCGTSVLARWFGQRTNRIRVHNHLDLQLGQGAVVGVQESALLKASVAAYFMPMLAMVGAALFAESQGAGDGEIAFWSIVGLGLGLLFLHRLSTGEGRSAYQPALLRKAPGVNQSFNMELQRGKLS